MVTSVLVSVLTYLSFIGWGRVVSKGVRLRTRADAGLIAAWGMAFTAVFGGILSLSGRASPGILRAYVLTGALLSFVWIFRSTREWQATDTWPKAGLWAIGALVTLGCLVLLRLMAATVAELNPHDDFQGYLVFPIRMLQTGSFGADPFNERRLLALGGQTILQGFQLVWGGWKEANSMDLGLGWLVCTGLIAGHAIQRRTLPIAALGLLIVTQFDHPPFVNLSSTVTGVALQYALLRTWFLESASSKWARLFLLALTIAGLCSLKNSLAVGSAAALGALWLAVDRQERVQRMFEVGLAVLVAGLFLAPWMIELHRSSGTWFYPLLGKGFHGSVYGDFPDVAARVPVAGFLRSFLGFSIRSRDTLAVGIALLAMPFIVGGSKPRNYRSWILLWTATWCAAVILSVQSGGLDRYSYPFVTATLFFLLVEYLPAMSEIKQYLDPRRFAVGVVLAFLLGINFQQGSDAFLSVFMRTVDSQEFDPAEYHNAQSAVPERAVILACLAEPFLLDFQRNTIYTVDHAGGSSPPPGMPVLGSDEDLTAYLRGQSIRYIIYSYADEANYGRQFVGDRLKLGGNFYNDRMRKLAEYNIAFRDHLDALSRQGAKVFDDGKVFVLDLSALDFSHAYSH